MNISNVFAVKSAYSFMWLYFICNNFPLWYYYITSGPRDLSTLNLALTVIMIASTISWVVVLAMLPLHKLKNLQKEFEKCEQLKNDLDVQIRAVRNVALKNSGITSDLIKEEIKILKGYEQQE